MAVFTKQDFLDGKCLHSEIGTEAEPRWSTLDAKQGRCTPEAVGTKRMVLPTTQNLNVREVVQRALNLMGEDDQLSAYLAERHDIMAPLVAKLGLSDITKEQEPPVEFEKIPDEVLLTMSTVELKRVLLASEGITKQSQLSDAKNTSI